MPDSSPTGQPDSPQGPSETPPILNYSSIPGTSFVTIRRMPPFEAELACAKLQSEGIPAFIADANMALIHPLLMGQVQLQVPETDVQAAEEVLSRPAAIDAEGDYADEDWRCPKCHRKQIDLLPLTRPWRWVRNGLIIAILAAIILGIFQASLDRDASRLVEPYLGNALLASILAVPILALSLLFARRTRRCQACGHEWRKGQSQSD